MFGAALSLSLSLDYYYGLRLVIQGVELAPYSCTVVGFLLVGGNCFSFLSSEITFLGEYSRQ